MGPNGISCLSYSVLYTVLYAALYIVLYIVLCIVLILYCRQRNRKQRGRHAAAWVASFFLFLFLVQSIVQNKVQYIVQYRVQYIVLYAIYYTGAIGPLNLYRGGRGGGGAKKAYKNVSGWTKAVREARKTLALTGFVAVNGKTAQGKALYAKAKAIYNQ